MGKIIVCIDRSPYADSVTHLSAWVHGRSGLSISLLHVLAPHSEMAAKADMSGQIGLGAKTSLMEELTQRDEERGKLELKKGQLVLARAKEDLSAKGITQLEVLHRRGALVESVMELEAQAELIVMGKRGEHHQLELNHLGSNLEHIVRTVHKPLLLATLETTAVNKFLIAYDGSPSANKAVEFAAHNALLKGLECHLLKVGEATTEAKDMLTKAENTLTSAGVAVHTSLMQGKPVDAIVAEYIAVHAIDLLAIGAYGHSKIFSLILGSTTTALIGKSDVPVLLFR